MKKITLLIFLALSYAIANAQFKQIAEGPAFQEPEDGFAKLLQMKNGNTIFIHISIKKGIEVHIYDPSHKETTVTNLEPSYGKLEHGSVDGIFEINGNAVLMITEIDSRVPVLYRLVIDGKTGNLKDDKKIAELNKITFGQGYAIAFGDVHMPAFYVRKDPLSDNYAVALFNSLESDRNKRIAIIAYGSDNRELTRAYYASPEEKYKYLNYIDMAVIGSDKVCILAYAYNTRSSGGKESELVLANLDKGSTSVNFTELNFSKDLIAYAGITRYSPATKSLILSAVVKSNPRESGFTPILAFINPFEKKVDRFNEISPSERLNQYSKDGYTGLPVNLFINDDGTFTVVSEEMTVVSTRSSTGGNSVNTILGDMAIVNYSKTGEPINDYVIRKSHELYQQDLGLFYHSYREGGAQLLFHGNQYKSFAFLDGKRKKFILFNDTQRNNDAQESGKIVNILGVSGTDGFYYPLTGSDAVPKRDYIFGKPEGKKDHDLALFAVSDYDKRNNVYATLKLENEHGKKVKVVWLQP
jgi:hypothetical protein